MKFKQTNIDGAYYLDVEQINDDRGFFGRTFCKQEFKKMGLDFDIVQCNMSHSFKKNTLRGMHYQTEPSSEKKLFRCIQGAVLDVIVDVRKDSSTYGEYFSINLTADNNRMIYIPEGVAHGFLTTENETKVFYMVSEFYSKNDSRTIRWNDPHFGIQWPVKNPILSENDAQCPNYNNH